MNPLAFFKFNQDQVVSLVQHGMTALGAVLVAHGATVANPTVWQPLTGAVVALASWAWQHYSNSAAGNP